MGLRTFSSVSRPYWTIESATWMWGILPLKLADVYPYVTFWNPKTQCQISSVKHPRPRTGTDREKLEGELSSVEYSAQTLRGRRDEVSFASSDTDAAVRRAPTLSYLYPFMAVLTMTLVSSSSPSIFASRLLRRVGFTNIIPFGDTFGSQRTKRRSISTDVIYRR